MSNVFQISEEYITLQTLREILDTKTRITLAKGCEEKIISTRRFLEDKISHSEQTFYGINTGFGSLYNVRIDPSELAALQSNLVLSHSAGTGDMIPGHVAKAVLLLKIVSLAKSRSGVRLEIVRRLVDMYNAHLIPVMYTFGSLGASGDLAPLSHLALTLIGRGQFDMAGEPVDAAAVLADHDMQPLTLEAKEGLALINGTQFSCGYALVVAGEAMRLLQSANMCAALSLDGFNCNTEALDERIHAVRNQNGQVAVAGVLRHYLHDSAIARSTDKQLQDPYAFRCIPQVHGATMDALDHCLGIFERECNAVTDNPLIFPESDGILSGGNFHGQPVALALDYLCIALAELGSISERRTYQLLSGQRGLPEYLTPRSGVQSGLMIAQYTAASLVDRNRLLCTPSTPGNAITSKGQEDHVSMSANAAIKVFEVSRNCRTLLAIECMTAMQALDFRAAQKTSSRLEEVRTAYRQVVPHLKEDAVVRDMMMSTEHFLKQLQFEHGFAGLPKRPVQN